MSATAIHSGGVTSAGPAAGTEREKLIQALIDITNPDSADGLRCVAINDLYECDLLEIEAMLMQIVHATVTHESCFVHLRKFLMHVASKSVYVGLRLSWIIDSISQAFPATSAFAKNVVELRDLLEGAIVNRPSSVAAAEALAGTPDEASVRREVFFKELRCTIYNDQRWFAKQLTQISQNLRLVADRSRRKGSLHIQLVELNEKLKQRRVFFPFGHSSEAPRWIVNIVWEECVVFSSRERAPYLIVVETATASPTPRTNGATPANVSFASQGVGGSTPPAPPGPRDGTAELSQMSANGAPAAVGGDAAFLVDVPTTLADPRPHFTSLAELAAQSSTAPPPPSVRHGRGHSRVMSIDAGSPDEVSLLSTVYGESSREKHERIRAKSDFGNLPGWECTSMIVKAGDDLRQEELALQLIALFNTIWKEAGCTASVKPYSAISTHTDCGVIECVTDATSIDSVKKSAQVQSLHQYFVRAYGGEDTKAFNIGQRNFIESMAGYSVICYLLQIKDRHNANLMLSRNGLLVHIDFGFMLATSPGGINFESAPFKLSQELVDVMGGVNSSTFEYFKVCVWQAFMAARERSDEVLALISLLIPSTNIPCFGSDPWNVLNQVRTRFRLELSDVEMAMVTKELILVSVDNWRTRKYDQFQTLQNGIV